MGKPEVPIDVDPATGIWHSDGLPMLYVPRHFFNNLHLGVEQMLGREPYRQSLHQSGYKSAWFWCDQSAREHSLQPVECFEFYLQRLSQRGWGQFSFSAQQLEQGQAEIRVSNSSFVLHKHRFSLESSTPSCYMFEGWFAGAADWVSEQLDLDMRFDSHEHSCASLSNDAQAVDCFFTLEKNQ